MNIPVAPCMATCRVSTQKSADGIVVSRKFSGGEGLNKEMSGYFISSHAAMNPTGGAD